MNKIRQALILMTALFGCAVLQAQGRFSMTTGSETGTPFSFTLNYGVEVMIDWGNGTPVKHLSLGDPITGTLKGTTVTVTGNDITLLECAEQKLTELNVTELADLGTLLCQKNQLTTLDITKNRKLSKLNAAHNRLTSLPLGSLNGITELVVNNNQLTALTVGANRQMVSLICNDNRLKTLYTTNLSMLLALWCQNNELTTLNLSKNLQLETLMCQNNAITTLNITGLTALTDVWCNDNAIKTLDVSSNSAIAYLSADNAAIENITFGNADKLGALYLNANKLGYNGLFSPRKLTNYVYQPQDSMPIARNLDTNTDLDLSAQLKTADGVATNATFKWFDGEKTLVPETDYTETGGVFRFKQPASKLYGEIGSTLFPQLSKIVTTTAVVVQGTGVFKPKSDPTLTIVSFRGKLTIHSQKAQPVRIYAITGALVRSFEKLEGSVEIDLPRGTYIVNQTKIIL